MTLYYLFVLSSLGPETKSTIATQSKIQPTFLLSNMSGLEVVGLVLTAATTVQESLRIYRHLSSGPVDDQKLLDRLKNTTERLLEIRSLYGDLIREQGDEIPEYVVADFKRTFERTTEAIGKFQRILSRPRSSARTIQMKEFDTTISSLGENIRALESILQATTIQVNMMTTSDLINAIEKSSTHPSLLFGSQSAEGQPDSEHAANEVKQRFILPSMLTFVGCKSFVCRLSILDVSSPKPSNLQSTFRFTNMRLFGHCRRAKTYCSRR